MKTLKIMSIIGIVLAAVAFMFMLVFNNSEDWESAVGWGFYAGIYLLAFSIVGLVQANRHQKTTK